MADIDEKGVEYSDDLFGVTQKLIKCPSNFKGGYVIPGGVTGIGSFAFSGCKGLTSVEMSDDVAEIGIGAFIGCTGLTSVEMTDSVAEIGSRAFEGCKGLASIRIPCNVKRISWKMFEGCTGLASVEIPGSVKVITSKAFYGCTGLTSVRIPHGVTNIGGQAFEGCTALTSIEIPDTVVLIGWNAFNDICSGEIHIRKRDPQRISVFEDAFNNTVENYTLYVPIGTEDIYRQHRVFGRFKEIVPEECKQTEE